MYGKCSPSLDSIGYVGTSLEIPCPALPTQNQACPCYEEGTCSFENSACLLVDVDLMKALVWVKGLGLTCKIEVVGLEILSR